MGAEVTGKTEFRMRKDHAENPGIASFSVFKKIWLLGVKAAFDIVIVELRAVEQHDSADILQKVRDESWPS